uniref:Uncharacterized protein n=1 Tax=Picea sitchensis TaxID=3332 RepID=A0A6B9XTR4_PICSI|nr:hypothetical protein Q903MT_gene3773 [Picea sitchensis]
MRQVVSKSSPLLIQASQLNNAKNYGKPNLICFSMLPGRHLCARADDPMDASAIHRSPPSII